MNVLLDECVPARFARSLVGHAVTTVPKHSWSGIKNGELLQLAEKEFDVLVTVDRNLAAQQDLKTFRIPMILIRARTNRLVNLRWRFKPTADQRRDKATVGRSRMERVK